MSRPIFKIKLKVGDVVQVRSGGAKLKDEINKAYKTGKVLAVHPKTNKVTVEGVNIVKKHIKRSRQNPQGGIVEITKPIDVSKVGIYDPVSKKPSRIAYKISKDGKRKTRVIKTSGKEAK